MSRRGATHAHPTGAHSTRARSGRRKKIAGPLEIPLAGLWQVAKRVRSETGRDNLSLLAAGVAFYFLLSVFPALIAVVNLYGLASDPEQIYRQIRELSAVLPPGAVELIDEQAREIVGGDSKAGLGIGFVASILGVLWSASAGTLGLIHAVNAAYDEDENRSFVKVRGLALAFTLGAIVFVLFAVGLVAVAPQALRHVGLGGEARTVIEVLRWPVLAAAMLSGLALVYRYAPARQSAGWRWVSWGSILATALWLGASALFSWYVSSFGRFNEVYGSLGAVIALLVWFFLTAYIVLLGAEVNAELERQGQG